jgi:GTP cyclohydrolase II
LTGPRDVARAIDALRRGWPVAVDQVSLLAVETADEAALAAFDEGGAPAGLLIRATARRRSSSPTSARRCRPSRC